MIPSYYHARLAGGVCAAAVAYATAPRFGWNRTAATTAVLCQAFFGAYGVWLTDYVSAKFFPFENDTKPGANRYYRNLMRSSLLGAAQLLDFKIANVAAGKLGAPITMTETMGITMCYSLVANAAGVAFNF